MAKIIKCISIKTYPWIPLYSLNGEANKYEHLSFFKGSYSKISFFKSLINASLNSKKMRKIMDYQTLVFMKLWHGGLIYFTNRVLFKILVFSGVLR
jgi:hypothetical protein